MREFVITPPTPEEEEERHLLWALRERRDEIMTGNPTPELDVPDPFYDRFRACPACHGYGITQDTLCGHCKGNRIILKGNQNNG